jgi:NAD(P)-dependent dehydrogenase (short-subunit alcohol dehydrogenase family)
MPESASRHEDSRRQPRPIPEIDILCITAGLGCDGDTIAMTAATQPSIEEILLGSRQLLERIPAGRWGEPKDIAGAALYLCSSASNYVHGHVPVVDGGWLAR